MTTNSPVGQRPVSEDDRMWGMLVWLPVVGVFMALFVLIAEDQRAYPFRKYHAVNALLFDIISTLVLTVLSLTLVGLCVTPAVLVYQLYVAYQAYQGQWTEVPLLTSLARDQGWL